MYIVRDPNTGESIDETRLYNNWWLMLGYGASVEVRQQKMDYIRHALVRREEEEHA